MITHSTNSQVLLCLSHRVVLLRLWEIYSFLHWMLEGPCRVVRIDFFRKRSVEWMRYLVSGHTYVLCLHFSLLCLSKMTAHIHTGPVYCAPHAAVSCDSVSCFSHSFVRKRVLDHASSSILKASLGQETNICRIDWISERREK